MVPIAVEGALHRVLEKSPGEPLKLSKNKVHKRLQKDHQELTEQQTRQLLQQVLTSSRQFVFDGKKVQLALTPKAAAPAHAPSSPAAATAAPAAASTGGQAGDKRPKSQEQDLKQHKKHKAAKQLEQQQQQHAAPATLQQKAQAASQAVEHQQRLWHIKQEKQDHHVQQPNKQTHMKRQCEQQQLLQPEQHQHPDRPKEHKHHKHQQQQPKAAGHITATAAQVTAGDDALRVEIPADQQITKSKEKPKHKHKHTNKQPDTAAAVAVPLPQDGEQQQQQQEQQQAAIKHKRHKKRKHERAGPAAAAAAGGDVLPHEQQQKQKKRKRQAEQPQPAVQSAKANGGADRQTDTSPGPLRQQQQQHPLHQHQEHEQQQQKKQKKTDKQKIRQHGDEHGDQSHVKTELQHAKTAAVVPVAAAPPTAARGVPQQQHNHHQQQQQQQRSAAATSARELLLQVMKGFKKQSAPSAAAPAAAAVAPLQQQSWASKLKAARHTILAPATVPSAATAAAGALAAVQNRIAAQQHQEQGEIEDSPARRRNRRSDTWRADYNRTDIKHGRFSAVEKEAVQKAIVEFAEEKGLPHGKGECGWLIDRKSAALKRGAITAIAAAVPHRTRKAVWQFVQANYTPLEAEGPFTPEEDAKLLELYTELGPCWKEIGGRLGRLDRAVKDRAKTLNFGKPKTAGRWTQEEIDALQSFVSAYQQALEASGSAEGDVRRISKSLLPSEDAEARPVGTVQLDDIDWEWVSSQMATRTARQCSERWHKRMAPGMINSGQWAPGNDTTMIQALAATPRESWQVNWEELVPGRTAQQCKRRWQVILRHLPVDVRNDFPKAVAEAAARLSQKQQKKNKKRNGSTDAA